MGLISDDAWADYLAKQERMSALKSVLEKTRVRSLSAEIAAKIGTVAGQTYAQLLKRPDVDVMQLVPALAPLMPDFFDRDTKESAAEVVTNVPGDVRNELKSIETEIKYEGYLSQQTKSIERLKKAEQRPIPTWFDYAAVSGLSREMKEKLQRVRPSTLGQASRIPGVTPAAVSLVNVFIEIQGRHRVDSVTT